MRAVGERITVAMLAGSRYFFPACRTHGRVGRHLRMIFAGNRRNDAKILKDRAGLHRSNLNGLYPCQRGRFPFQSLQKPAQGGIVSRHRNQDAFRIVANLSRKTAFFRKPPNGGPETDTLHGAAHANLQSFATAIRRSRRSRLGKHVGGRKRHDYSINHQTVERVTPRTGPAWRPLLFSFP